MMQCPLASSNHSSIALAPTSTYMCPVCAAPIWSHSLTWRQHSLRCRPLSAPGRRCTLLHLRASGCASMHGQIKFRPFVDRLHLDTQEMDGVRAELSTAHQQLQAAQQSISRLQGEAKAASASAVAAEAAGSQQQQCLQVWRLILPSQAVHLGICCHASPVQWSA